jgi:hypothetical protein
MAGKYPNEDQLGELSCSEKFLAPRIYDHKLSILQSIVYQALFCHLLKILVFNLVQMLNLAIMVF